MNDNDIDETSTRGIDRFAETVNDQLSSRRRFMATTTAVGGAGLAAASPVGGRSEHGGNNSSDDNGSADESSSDDGPSDVDILNFALKLEYLEAEFYKRGIENMGCSTITNSQTLEAIGGACQDRAFDDLEVIRDHEVTHVEVIDQTVQDLGGEPIDQPEFDFGSAVTDPNEFLATAAVLENTGVGAYAGAAPMIDNQDLIPPALSIHSVEARHASFLNVLNGEIGFPNAFDEALTIEEVNERAGPFIVSE